MKINTKKTIKVTLDRIGLSIKPARNGRPLDLRAEELIDPVSALYSSEGRDVLINVPIEHCRTHTLSAFPPITCGHSPFVHTIRSYYEDGIVDYDQSPLRGFYDCYTPQSVSELMGLANPSCGALAQLPASAAFVPWRAFCPDSQSALRNQQIERDNQEHGVRLAAKLGDPLYGPVYEAKGRLEFKRLISIAASIRANGLTVDPRGIDNITVVTLVSGNNWRLFVASSGQHRLSALGALGFRSVVVQLRAREGSGGIVRRCEAKNWPAVRRGFLTETEAVKVFDRLFDGQQPEIATRWLSRLAALETEAELCHESSTSRISEISAPR